MSKIRYGLVLGLGLSALALTGCANMSPVSPDDVIAHVDEVDPDTVFYKNVSVETEGFKKRETEPFSGEVRHNLSNKGAKEAVRKTFERSKLYAEDGEYVVNLKLVHAGRSDSLNEDDEVNGRSIRVKFNIINREDNHLVHEGLIVGNGVKYSDKLFKSKDNPEEDFVISSKAYNEFLYKLVNRVKIINYFKSRK